MSSMRDADHYHGDVATRYEARRKPKESWKREQEAVASFLRDGPVLDVPLGTGRYIPLYRERKISFVGVDISEDMLSIARTKYPGIDARLGTIFHMEFADKSFETGVCTRMMNWFYPDQMFKAMAEIKRICKKLIVSVHTGKEGNKPIGGVPRGTYTHSPHTFLEACDGFLIDKRQQIDTVPGGIYEMLFLRPATWADVIDQFQDKREPLAAIKRLSSTWIRRMKMPRLEIDSAHTKVRACSWTHVQIGELLTKMMALREEDQTATSELLTNQKPTQQDRPLTIFRSGDQYAGIDGRRRMNLWKDRPGRYPVLLIEPKGEM